MTTFNYLLVFGAILMFFIGIFGYVKKKWGIKLFVHIFVVIPVFVFWFAFYPLINPYASIGLTIARGLIIFVGGEVFAYFLIKLVKNS